MDDPRDYNPTDRSDDELVDDLLNHSDNSALGPDDTPYVASRGEDGELVAVLPWDSGAIASKALLELATRGVPIDSFTEAVYWTNAARSAALSSQWGDTIALAEFSRGEIPGLTPGLEKAALMTFFPYATLAVRSVGGYDEVRYLESQYGEADAGIEEDGPTDFFDSLATSFSLIDETLSTYPADEVRDLLVDVAALRGDLDEAIDASFERWSS